MSNVEARAYEETAGGPGAAARPVRQELLGRRVVLGTRGLAVTRTLPHRDRRMVGAWCFVDHYGPEDIGGGPGMRVPPHPHTGLQTVSWLVAGQVRHQDSLGNDLVIHPGQLGLMTAGRGIAHAETSPVDHPPLLHGVQLWVALPGSARDVPPGFGYHPDPPVLAGPGSAVTVIAGELGGARSPATGYTPLLGAEINLEPGAAVRLSLRPDFEHAVLVLSGAAAVDGVPTAPGPLVYLGRDRRELEVRADRPGTGARLLLLGGEPFAERIVMWWNFVARDHQEILASRADWAAGRRFGVVTGYDGPALPAPPPPTTPLRPRGRDR